MDISSFSKLSSQFHKYGEGEAASLVKEFYQAYKSLAEDRYERITNEIHHGRTKRDFCQLKLLAADSLPGSPTCFNSKRFVSTKLLFSPSTPTVSNEQNKNFRDSSDGDGDSPFSSRSESDSYLNVSTEELHEECRPTVQEQNDKFRRELDNSEHVRKALESSMVKLQEEIHDLRRQNNSFVVENSSAQREISALKGQIEELKKENSALVNVVTSKAKHVEKLELDSLHKKESQLLASPKRTIELEEVVCEPLLISASSCEELQNEIISLCERKIEALHGQARTMAQLNGSVRLIQPEIFPLPITTSCKVLEKKSFAAYFLCSFLSEEDSASKSTFHKGFRLQGVLREERTGLHYVDTVSLPKEGPKLAKTLRSVSQTVKRLKQNLRQAQDSLETSNSEQYRMAKMLRDIKRSMSNLQGRFFVMSDRQHIPLQAGSQQFSKGDSIVRIPVKRDSNNKQQAFGSVSLRHEASSESCCKVAIRRVEETWKQIELTLEKHEEVSTVWLEGLAKLTSIEISIAEVYRALENHFLLWEKLIVSMQGEIIKLEDHIRDLEVSNALLQVEIKSREERNRERQERDYYHFQARKASKTRNQYLTNKACGVSQVKKGEFRQQATDVSPSRAAEWKPELDHEGINVEESPSIVELQIVHQHLASLVKVRNRLLDELEKGTLILKEKIDDFEVKGKPKQAHSVMVQRKVAPLQQNSHQISKLVTDEESSENDLAVSEQVGRSCSAQVQLSETHLACASASNGTISHLCWQKNASGHECIFLSLIESGKQSMASRVPKGLTGVLQLMAVWDDALQNQNLIKMKSNASSSQLVFGLSRQVANLNHWEEKIQNPQVDLFRCQEEHTAHNGKAGVKLKKIDQVIVLHSLNSANVVKSRWMRSRRYNFAPQCFGFHNFAPKCCKLQDGNVDLEQESDILEAHNLLHAQTKHHCLDTLKLSKLTYGAGNNVQIIQDGVYKVKDLEHAADVRKSSLVMVTEREMYEEIILSLQKEVKIWKAESSRQSAMVIERCKEKREAIKQLGIALDHVQEENKNLKKVIKSVRGKFQRQPALKH